MRRDFPGAALLREGAIMCILRSKFVPIGVVFIVSLLALGSMALGRGADLAVPMGALAHAAEAFESNTGGKVLEIRVANEAGAPAFEAALLNDDGVVYMRIASPSDDVTEIEAKNLPPWLQNYKLEAYARSATQAQVPIEQAILMAEKRDSAPAVDAGIAKPLDGTNAVLAYFVETLKGHKHQMSAIDAKSGALIANPETLYEPHTPVDLARRIAPP
jgi:uncharacterized membrane protein YkoI